MCVGGGGGDGGGGGRSRRKARYFRHVGRGVGERDGGFLLLVDFLLLFFPTRFGGGTGQLRGVTDSTRFLSFLLNIYPLGCSLC